MTKFNFKAITMLVFFSGLVNAEEPKFSSSTKELHIPIVNVDNNTFYSVDMILSDDKEQLIFTLVGANKLPTFEERFENIQNGMSRQQTIEILGIPQKIKNLQIKAGALCSEPLLKVGSAYEQWEYGLDANSQISSGFVVWFSAVNSSPEWEAVGKTNQFSCI